MDIYQYMATLMWRNFISLEYQNYKSFLIELFLSQGAHWFIRRKNHANIKNIEIDLMKISRLYHNNQQKAFVTGLIMALT